MEQTKPVSDPDSVWHCFEHCTLKVLSPSLVSIDHRKKLFFSCCFSLSPFRSLEQTFPFPLSLTLVFLLSAYIGVALMIFSNSLIIFSLSLARYSFVFIYLFFPATFSIILFPLHDHSNCNFFLSFFLFLFFRDR